MNEKLIFVGRQEELEQFKKILQDPQGQAVLVIGQTGMGKTFLVDKMAEIAADHPDFKCFVLRYEVTPTDPANTIMAEIMDDAADAIDSVINKVKKLFKRNKSKLAVVFNVGGLIPIVGSRAKAVNDLVVSLTERDKAGNVREQFIEILQKLSDNMPDKSRAIFVIDPVGYMQKESDYAWGLVIRQLPPKIKFLFPQRPEDVLVKGEGLTKCNNIVRIPEGQLKRFDDKTIEELVKTQSQQVPEQENEMRIGTGRSDKSPYAVSGMLELIAKTGIKLDDLAQYLGQREVARAQWRGICNNSENAKQLFEGYAILEVGVPDEIIEYVSGLNSYQIQHLSADNYLKGLLREEGEGKRIYHSILTEYILGQMNDAEKKKQHSQAVKIYRGKLKKARAEQTKPDELAATRLPEHVLAAEGQEAFVSSFINECFSPLRTLGALDSCISLSERALQMVKKGSERQTMLLGNLGLIYQHRGELEKAEEMLKKSLQINEKLGRLKGMANQFCNLGNAYYMRGDLDKAEEMQKKALAIDEKLGRLDGMASDYGNLGIVYMARGDLDKAEEMHKKSLQIEEKLGRLEGIASEYSNLGIIYQMRGELDKAEEMHKKSLRISEKLGHQEGIATNYHNLGLIYQKRGDMKKAKEYWVKARDLFEKIGMPHRIKQVQGWIDSAEDNGKGRKL
ncbi:MAG: tetratricopeptide repeat protein [Phycisphaerae bacterium]|nr:tetratricopeptide repeat protein [Phycisphaerae bacterium]